MSAVATVLLVVHVFAAIMFIGAATVATAVFPRHLLRQWRGPGNHRALLVELARVTRRYGTLALLVPAVGLVLGLVRGQLTEAWLNVSLVLAAVAGYLLVVSVRTQDEQLRLFDARAGTPATGRAEPAPTQEPAPAREPSAAVREEVPVEVAGGLRRLRSAGGTFNVVWLVILVLMVWRPGGQS